MTPLSCCAVEYTPPPPHAAGLGDAGPQASGKADAVRGRVRLVVPEQRRHAGAGGLGDGVRGG